MDFSELLRLANSIPCTDPKCGGLKDHLERLYQEVLRNCMISRWESAKEFMRTHPEPKAKPSRITLEELEL